MQENESKTFLQWKTYLVTGLASLSYNHSCLARTFFSFLAKKMHTFITNFCLENGHTVELQWLEHLWDHKSKFETGVVRANEG